MTQQVITIGAAPDDGTGDPLRTSFNKTNQNFTELYARTSGAPVGAEYITSTADATLTAERVLTDTATVTWDRTTAGQIKATAVGGVVPAPQRTVLISGSGTYTTPAGATWLEVELIGGGGGGAGGEGSGATNGGNGITSIFSGLSAFGGLGGRIDPAPGAGGGTSGTDVNDVTSTGGFGSNANNTGQGGIGGASTFGGQSYSTNPGARGAGGAGGGTAPGSYGGGGGGAGGYVRSIITSPGVSYSYAVGAPGSAGNGGSPNGGAGSAGNAGIIIVTAHFGG